MTLLTYYGYYKNQVNQLSVAELDLLKGWMEALKAQYKLRDKKVDSSDWWVQVISDYSKWIDASIARKQEELNLLIKYSIQWGEKEDLLRVSYNYSDDQTLAEMHIKALTRAYREKNNKLI